MDAFRRLFSSEEPEHNEPDDKNQDAATKPTRPNSKKMDTVELEVNPTPPSPADGATRQLPMETVIATNNARITFGQATDVGMMREKNEDSCLSMVFTSASVDEMVDFGLFIVADGMGGHSEGEKASAITTRTVAYEITKAIHVPMLSRADRSDVPPMTELMVEALEKANSAVFAELNGTGGTTCTAALVYGDRIYIGHVGDSRAYLINKREIEQLTRDHSMVQRLVEVGQITQEQTKNMPNNKLYRTLGIVENLEVDLSNRRLTPRSKVLLCSDGLWNHVDEATLVDMVYSNDDPQTICDKLVARANTEGGSDNITVILINT